MSQRSEAERPATEDLSALMDGELDVSALTAACRAWRDDPEVRRQWHAYHLIGDVMRSEDLVSRPEHDAAFLVALRQRMAEEPVVLAPSPMVAQAQVATRARRAWRAPAAVAAGFAVVAGTLVVTQMSLRAPADAAMAQSSSPAQTVALSDKAASATADPQGMVLNGKIVRDARLDEYLAAHKKFGGSSLPGGPSGFLRNASVEVPAR
ncbi:MAG TPA: sigma-E factor negative regulatory protein [Rhizobacter sp.]